MGSKSRVDSRLLERFRQTGIRLDRTGTFWHDGQPITHRGLHSALLRWLDELHDGTPILRLDAERYAYVEVEDAPLLVVSLRWNDDRAFAKTNDGNEEELAYASLCVSSDHTMYCRVRGDRLTARLTTPAYYQLVQRIEEDRGEYHLRAIGQRFTIRDCSRR